MNIAEFEMIFYSLGAIIFVLVIISQVMRYVQICKYEKRIKKQINRQGYTTDIFDYDVMHHFFDYGLGSLEAANEMIAVFENRPKTAQLTDIHGPL